MPQRPLGVELDQVRLLLGVGSELSLEICAVSLYGKVRVSAPRQPLEGRALPPSVGRTSWGVAVGGKDEHLPRSPQGIP